jgi:hypothetical protein
MVHACTWKEIERAQNRGCQSLNYKERTVPTIHREEILVGGLTLLSSFRLAISGFWYLRVLENQ